jgi:hypothetical protein
LILIKSGAVVRPPNVVTAICRSGGTDENWKNRASAIDLGHIPPAQGLYQSPVDPSEVNRAMTKPIPDKAEVALEYPDKLYIGTFERTARFDAHLDEAGISLSLHRTGEAEVRKSVRMHFHYALFAEILRELAKTVSSLPPADAEHRDALRAGAKALYRALDAGARDTDSQSGTRKSHARARKDEADLSRMTPEEEVLLLHVME